MSGPNYDQVKDRKLDTPIYSEMNQVVMVTVVVVFFL